MEAILACPGPISGTKKGINIKNLGRNPPSQTPPPQGTADPPNSLCLVPLFPSKYRKKKAYMKNFEGGGLGGPKILYAEFLRVLFSHLTILVPSVPSGMGLGQAEADFLASTQDNSLRLTIVVSVIPANLPTRVPVCLLNNAKSPVGMTDLKIKWIFWGIGKFFTVTDFKFWRICLVNILVGMVYGFTLPSFAKSLHA